MERKQVVISRYLAWMTGREVDVGNKNNAGPFALSGPMRKALFLANCGCHWIIQTGWPRTCGKDLTRMECSFRRFVNEQFPDIKKGWTDLPWGENAKQGQFQWTGQPKAIK